MRPRLPVRGDRDCDAETAVCAYLTIANGRAIAIHRNENRFTRRVVLPIHRNGVVGGVRGSRGNRHESQAWRGSGFGRLPPCATVFFAEFQIFDQFAVNHFWVRAYSSSGGVGFGLGGPERMTRRVAPGPAVHVFGRRTGRFRGRSNLRGLALTKGLL